VAAPQTNREKVDGARLTARSDEIFRLRSVSLRKFAKTVPLGPDRLVKLRNGRLKSCDARSFRALCSRLEVSPGWLRGDPNAAAPGAIGEFLATLVPYSLRDPNARPRIVPTGMHAELPALAQLEMDGVFRAITAVLPKQQPSTDLLFASMALVDLTRWRTAIFGERIATPSRKETERFAAGMRQVLEVLLFPASNHGLNLTTQGSVAGAECWQTLKRLIVPPGQIPSVAIEGLPWVPLSVVSPDRKNKKSAG
jgi:hypothetical protein